MIKTLNPYPNPAKTAEIMSRYRPIAPKPDPTNNNNNNNSITDDASNINNISNKIKQSPYLRHFWPQLQARPTRSRKRGRSSGPISFPPSLKRPKSTTNPQILGFFPPISKNLSFQHSFNLSPLTQIPNNNHAIGAFNCNLEKSNSSLVTLPLLPSSSSSSSHSPNTPPPKFDVDEPIDLKLSTNDFPEEKDLLQQLQKPVTTTTNKNGTNSGGIIAPQPIRPIGSCISVGGITEDSTLAAATPALSRLPPKKPEEVEEEVECEALPAVVSDSKNRVRMANSAYKEMVGQPECPWLESMVNGGGGKRKRISGEVTLHLGGGGDSIPVASRGFSCWVRIEWQEQGGEEKRSVNAFCDVVKCCCESRDYMFTWRFHTRTTTREGEGSQSSCNV